jgi:hypothetical protein
MHGVRPQSGRLHTGTPYCAQLSEAHSIDGVQPCPIAFRHAPASLQLRVPAHWSSSPLVTSVHSPGFLAQVSHGPLHGFSQRKPSTQGPLPSSGAPGSQRVAQKPLEHKPV